MATSSIATGASFTGVTVSSNTFESVNSPSFTETEMFTSPFQFSTGVNVNCSPTTEAVIYSLPLSTVKPRLSTSTSLADKVIVSGVSSAVDISAIAANSGPSFTGVTFN